MTELRLPRLPDRAPLKIAISVSPDLNQALQDYARLYGESYGSSEPVQELIPAMLATFLEGDRTFVRWRREQRSRGA